MLILLTAGFDCDSILLEALPNGALPPGGMGTCNTCVQTMDPCPLFLSPLNRPFSTWI